MSDKVYSIEEIRAILKPVFENNNIKKAILFGSYAKGYADKNSDVDLVVESCLKGLKFIGLIEDIHEALDKDVDVYDVTHIKPGSVLESEIASDGIVIF